MFKLNDKAPDFELKDNNGNSIKLSNYKDKTIVLYFLSKRFYSWLYKRSL